MAKTALQFRHNGRDVAIFVEGGTNLLVALRELIGDMTPKFGCGQGGCGACSVLIDGELHLSCLTLAETVAGRSVEITSTPARTTAPPTTTRSESGSPSISQANTSAKIGIVPMMTARRAPGSVRRRGRRRPCRER